MSKRRPEHATLYDFRDLDIMYRIAHEANGGIPSAELAELLGFDADSGAAAVGRRLGWMRRYGMVNYNEDNRLWTLSSSGNRVTQAQLRAAQAKTIDQLPDESMIEVMAHVATRYQLGEPMLAHLLRREFLYGIGLRKKRL